MRHSAERCGVQAVILAYETGILTPGCPRPRTRLSRGEIVRAAATLHAEDDDFGQPRAPWDSVLSDTGRDHLVSNITGHASAPEVTGEMKSRVAEYWRHVHPDLGARVPRASTAADGRDPGRPPRCQSPADIGWISQAYGNISK